MESRLNKYNNNDEENTYTSRAQKNASLYSEINDMNINSFDVNSNSEILEQRASTIDIDKLKDMLDRKYREEVHTHPIGRVDNIKKTEEIKLDETREYDINSALDKAKENKENDYEVERLKKLRNTQVDILNNLEIESMKKVPNKAVSKSEGERLKSLIDTINLTEETNSIKDMDPLDILSDLKGDDEETKVIGANDLEEITKQITKESTVKEDDKELGKTKEFILDKEEIDRVKNEAKEEIHEDLKAEKIIDDVTKDEPKKKKDKFENSFYTSTSMLSKSDFDDFSDLKDDISATKIIVKILIVVVIIAFIVGVVFLLNKILEWGLF